MINFIQEIPNITSVNELLNWALGTLTAVIAYLYVTKTKEVNKLNDKIENLYKEHKDDFKEFSQEKTDTFMQNNQTMQKMMLLLDQLKEMIRDNDR